MKGYNKLNFHKHTYCEFEMMDVDFFNQNSIHYKSKSGSMYFYSDEGVYRHSNHWGRVANCRWKINGVENYKNQNYYTGYTNWNEFYALNSTEKDFFVNVNFEDESVKILKDRSQLNQDNYLMSLNFALKRTREIKKLFKDVKWAAYFSVNVGEIRKELIALLLNSDKPFQELKRSLVAKFN